MMDTLVSQQIFLCSKPSTQPILLDPTTLDEGDGVGETWIMNKANYCTTDVVD